MVVTSKIQDSLGSWYGLFANFIISDHFNKIFGHLKAAKTSGKNVYPTSDNLFKNFRVSNKDSVKCIIVTGSPYSKVIDIKGVKTPVANGIPLDCNSVFKEKGLTTELWTLYEALEGMYMGHMDPEMELDGDLSYLARQGVFLCSVSYTTEENSKDSHVKIWEAFNRYFWTQIINTFYRGLPILYIGEVAKKSAELLTPDLHYPFFLPELPSTGVKGQVYNSDRVFWGIDKVLRENYKEQIHWYRRKNDTEGFWDLPF